MWYVSNMIKKKKMKSWMCVEKIKVLNYNDSSKNM